METLERTQVGPFLLRDSLSMEEIQKKVEVGDLSGMLLSSGLLAQHLPSVNPGEKELADLCQGVKIKFELPEPGLYRVMRGQDQLCAIAEFTGDGLLKPKKVFGVEGIY